MTLKRLHDAADPSRLDGMERFGISVDRALGVSLPKLRSLAKEIGQDHALALGLWRTELHEARILASMVDEPDRVTEAQMDVMVGAFHSWDLCDQCCNNLFRLTPYAWNKSQEWCDREEEFVRRAGFAMMASLAVHDHRAADEDFRPFLEAIERHGVDDRNYVRKAVNWALRQIGKRNLTLNAMAVQTAERLLSKKDRASRWVALDALRELRSEAVRQRLKDREV